MILDICYKCKGEKTLTLYSGSIHDPIDPEIITCPICKGEGTINYVENIH